MTPIRPHTAALLVALWGAAAGAQDTIKMNVAYHPNMHGGAIIAIAEEQGYFEEEGLEVNAARFTSGAPELSAMIAGQLDIGYLGPGAMPAVMRGEVQLLTLNHANSSDRILAAEETSVVTPADLEGRQVFFATGTTGEFVVRAALRSAGLGLNDIEAQNATDEVTTTAYITDRADIISVGPTFTKQALEQRPSIVVYDSSEDDSFALPGFWIANKEYVQQNPEAVARFLRAFGKANDWRAANLEESVPLTSRYTEVPEPILEDQIALTTWWTTEEINAAIADGTVRGMLERLNEMFLETGKMAEIASVDSYFDPDLTLLAYEGSK